MEPRRDAAGVERGDGPLEDERFDEVRPRPQRASSGSRRGEGDRCLDVEDLERGGIDEAGVSEIGVVGGAWEREVVDPKGEGEIERPTFPPSRVSRRAEIVPVSIEMMEARLLPGSGTTREARRDPASGSR